MARLEFLPTADADLDDIYNWIAPHNEDAAARLIGQLTEAAKRLRANPESGSEQPDIGPSVRSIPVRKYLILHRYRSEQDIVEIVRVVHGARDLRGLLDD